MAKQLIEYKFDSANKTSQRCLENKVKREASRYKVFAIVLQTLQLDYLVVAVSGDSRSFASIFVYSIA